MNSLPIFRAWYDDGVIGRKCYCLSEPFTMFDLTADDDGAVWYPFGGYGQQIVDLMQWIEKDDKKGQHIFVGDILKIRVLRHDGDATTPNKNHGSYYLYAEVMDLRGNLRYSRDAIEALEKPMGKEIFAQSVGYDYRLFHEMYYCVHLKKDKTGNYIIDGKNTLGNYKRFYDYEVVGNIKENPELMDSLEIMKVPKSEALLT